MRTGNLLFISGQLPMRDGQLIARGKVPSAVSLEQAQQAAAQCAVNALAIAGEEIAGDCSKIARVVRIGVFVQSDDSFHDQAKVANGASELLQQLFGDSRPPQPGGGGNQCFAAGCGGGSEFLFRIAMTAAFSRKE